MSPDEHPFLDAILARPHDDGPRLVYADYLDESNSPADAARAELIRTQIALARLPQDHHRRTELADRQAELGRQFHDTWTAPLAGLATHVEFRRGIPDSVVADAATFLERGDELFRRTAVGTGRSLVHRVRLLDPAVVLPKLVQCPFLAHVRELDLCGCELGNGGVNLLVRSPHLAGLRVLDLGFNGLDDAAVRLLGQTATLPGLRELALNDNGQITGEGVAVLAGSPHLAGLEVLDISGNDVSDMGPRAVARGFPRLHTLRLAGNHIGDAGIAALVRSELLRRMLARSPRLDMRANTIGPVGARLLAGYPGLGRAVSLELTGNYLGDTGFAAVLGSPHTARLRVLRLGRNQITDAGVVAARGLLAGGLLDHLQVLDLSGNRLTRFGIGVVMSAVAAGSGRAVAIDVAGNVQAPGRGEVPVPVSEVMPGVLGGMVASAHLTPEQLKQRVTHPAHRT